MGFSTGVANSVLVFLFVLFWSHRGMWDLSPRPGIEPTSPALEVQSLNHWTTREVPVFLFYLHIMYYLLTKDIVPIIILNRF